MLNQEIIAKEIQDEKLNYTQNKKLHEKIDVG